MDPRLKGEDDERGEQLETGRPEHAVARRLLKQLGFSQLLEIELGASSRIARIGSTEKTADLRQRLSSSSSERSALMLDGDLNR